MVFLRRHWRDIVIGLLGVGLVVLGNSYTSIYNKYEEAQADYQWARQSLERSTKQLVEVRKKLVPKQFESYEELAGWVAEWEVENKPLVVEFFNKTYVLRGNDELYSAYWDCDDISEAMQRDAIKDGYLMSVAVVGEGGYLYGVRVSEYEYHAGNMAVAGNAFYFIEPQTGEIVRIVGRD